MAIGRADKWGISMKRRDQGMTILEVVVAITIFLIGVGFIAQSNAVAFHYRARQEIRQQMIFYAAGQLEAVLELKKDEKVSETATPFNTFATEIIKNPSDEQMEAGNDGIDKLPLQEIDVVVSVKKNDGSIDPNIPSVTMKTYRVWTKTP